jgi:type I restriction enzyme S subunit
MVEGKYCVSDNTLIIQFNQNMDILFFYYLLSNCKLNTLVFGSGQPLITGSQLKDLSISLPPLPEQQAIASALSDVDALITALELLITKKRNIKQGAMQQLLTGKKRLPGFGGAWEVKELNYLCNCINDGTHHTPKYVDDGVPFYSVENVTANNFSDTKFISQNAHNELIKRCKPERGDILLTRIGTLGKTKLVDWDVNASIYVSLALLKVNDQIDKNYFYQYTKSWRFVKDIEKRSLLNAVPQKINMADIGNVRIKCPPTIEEQKAIAQILSDMDTEIESLEQKRNKYKAIKQGMMQELLTGKRRLLA